MTKGCNLNTNHFLKSATGQVRRSAWKQVRHNAWQHISNNVRSLTLLVVTGLMLAFPAFGQDSAGERAPYMINPGDLLEVSVWKELDLQRQVLVRPDGAFSFPLSGDIVAVGRTVESIRSELTRKLEAFIPDLVVTVTVEEIRGNKIFVLGQVNNPGEIVMNPQVDVMQALSIAGGTTAFAQLNNIRIIRRRNGTQTIQEFRYNDIVKGQNLAQNILLEVGDVVLVP